MPKPTTACVLCGELIDDPTTFYLCASNAKGDSEKIMYRQVFIEMEGCQACCRKLSGHETAINVGGIAGILGAAGALLLFQFKPEGIPSWAMWVCCAVAGLGGLIAVMGSVQKSGMRTANPSLEKIARAIAGKLDLGGKPAVFPQPNLPRGAKAVRLEQIGKF